MQCRCKKNEVRYFIKIGLFGLNAEGTIFPVRLPDDVLGTRIYGCRGITWSHAM